MATIQSNSNFFALLNDLDDDVSKALEKEKAAVKAAKANPKAKDSLRPSTADKEKKGKNERADNDNGNGRGRGGKGRGTTRSGVNEVEQRENGNRSKPIGQPGNNGKDGFYNQGYRRFQNGNGDGNRMVCGDGYQRNYGGKLQGGRGRGQYPAGRGRGRVNQVPVVKGDHNQPETIGKEEGSGGSEEQWTEIQFHRNPRQFRNNGYGNYGGERRQNDGAFRRSTYEGSNSVADDVSKSFEKKEVNGNKEHTTDGENGIAVSEVNVPASTVVSKEEEERKRQQEKAKQEWEERQERQRRRQEEWEEEKKKMTLEQYEEILAEKREALEALKKSEERKVTLDKELESMKVLRKNKEDEDVVIKLYSEKDKVKRGTGEKEEKGRKALSIDEFLKPSRGQFNNRRGPRQSTLVENNVTPAIGDIVQFPLLGAAAKQSSSSSN
ncbi:hypothetical protein LguiA_011774 [Lonicera macranthoides]